MSKIIELKLTGTYKDGGSESYKIYKDKNGNKYWRNYKFGERNTPQYGRLYVGNINNKKRVEAKGTFLIDTILGGEGIIQ